MKEILYHLLGSCGEGHMNLITIFSSGIIYLYKDYIVAIIKEIRDGFR